MANEPLNAEQIQRYREDGYVLAKGLFDSQEIGLLHRAAKEDRELDQHSFAKSDGEGGSVAFPFGTIRVTPFMACSPDVKPL